jgi:hypothetical protein
MRSIKELLWLMLEEMLFGMGLVDITSRRARNEYAPRHNEWYVR